LTHSGVSLDNVIFSSLKNGVGFTKTYLFQIPLTFTRISSPFTNKRYHPVLKRYRAHLGTDFATSK
jgi:murein DD-endopeptidase MepM/ murein hydrolase activator NlpD